MCLCRDYMSDRQELDGETVLKGGGGAKTRRAEKLETKLGRKKRKEKKRKVTKELAHADRVRI